MQGTSYWKNRTLKDKERDWGYKTEDWVTDYVASAEHPHRDVIVQMLSTFEWTHLLEVGCSAGPNLLKLRDAFPEKALFGLEVNEYAIEKAHEVLPASVEIKQGDVRDGIPWDGFDVILVDAALLYITPKEIDTVLDELTAKARHILLVERHAKTNKVVGHVWGRDYTKLLSERGFDVTEQDMTEDDWPTSKNWVKYGKFYLGHKGE